MHGSPVANPFSLSLRVGGYLTENQNKPGKFSSHIEIKFNWN